MSAVETIREAAALMRERAQAADREWNADIVPGDSLHLWVTDYDPSDPSGQTAMQRIVGGAESPWAEHISSWHPLVALDVADLLNNVIGAQPHDIAAIERDALAVALSYLGRQQ